MATEIALHLTSGITKYAESVEAMLVEYNRDGRFYEIRTDEQENQILWHKGQRRACGVFKTSDRT